MGVPTLTVAFAYSSISILYHLSLCGMGSSASGPGTAANIDNFDTQQLEAIPYPFESVIKSGIEIDPNYPGTAVQRLRSVLTRVHALGDLNGPWPDVRRQLLVAGGLREDYSTSHAFNDDNHCDLTTMLGDVSYNSNSDGAVAVISRRNQLGPHIAKASLPAHGPGGSWSTCTNGAHQTPPRDVAHVQFSSRIAFKLVWTPPDFNKFVLVDDEGRELKRGQPVGSLPSIHARKGNYALVRGGKYAVEADAIAAGKLKVCDSGVTFGNNSDAGA